MSYVYRYVDAEKGECIYVGKVNGCNDIGVDPLSRRHNQHKRDDWYKDHGGAENVFMEICEFEPQAEADIFETAMIAFYSETGQLEKKAKLWGKQNIVDVQKQTWIPYGSKWAKVAGEDPIDYLVEETTRKAKEYINRAFYEKDVDITTIGLVVADKVTEALRDYKTAHLAFISSRKAPYLRGEA